jgi:ubiquitin thioesterase OTU1
VVNLDDTQTVENLRKTIATETSLTIFDIKYGYPPKTLPLDQYPPSTLLCDLDVKLNGEQLIVSKKDAESAREVTSHTSPANATTSSKASSSADAVRDTK